jgi:hypothetical protein
MLFSYPFFRGCYVAIIFTVIMKATLGTTIIKMRVAVCGTKDLSAFLIADLPDLIPIRTFLPPKPIIGENKLISYLKN